jgi:hypothetical protein
VVVTPMDRFFTVLTRALQVVSGAGGLYAGYRLLDWVDREFASAPKKETPQEGGASALGALVEPPADAVVLNPSINIPALPYRAHTLTEIFTSALTPLLEFDVLADEFVERKDVAERAAAELAVRRKKGSVPPAEGARITNAWASIQAEERAGVQPRLEVLRELYFRRSRELMQRSQYNGERLVAAGRAVIAAAPADKPALQAVADALRAEIGVELAEYQKVAAANQGLKDIVRKYSLRGAEASAARQMD